MENSGLESSGHTILSGHFLHKSEGKDLEVWLEENGSFRLRYEERDEDGVAVNEEKGIFRLEMQGNDKVAVLVASERRWNWKDLRNGDSGVDQTDLKYPFRYGPDGNSIEVSYLNVSYSCKRV